MSAAWKIGLGLLLLTLSWSLYAWRMHERPPQVPFPSEAFVPVWTPAEAAAPTNRRGEVLLFFSPDECGQTVARTAAFWVEGARALGFRVVGILEDRSRALAWRYAAGMAFPFAVWWDSLGWYGRHYGTALLPRAVVRWEGRVVGDWVRRCCARCRGLNRCGCCWPTFFVMNNRASCIFSQTKHKEVSYETLEGLVGDVVSGGGGRSEPAAVDV